MQFFEFKHFFTKDKNNAIPIEVIEHKIFSEWLIHQNEIVTNWCKNTGFTAEPNTHILIPNSDGTLNKILAGVDNKNNPLNFIFLSKHLINIEAVYFENNNILDEVALFWGMNSYHFTKYKKYEKKHPKLFLDDTVDTHKLSIMLESIFMGRDLINTPTEDMGPDALQQVVEDIAHYFNAEFNVIFGQELLEQNFPLIHAVGRAAAKEPRLLDLKWGNENHPKLTLVGKGVCYDTGGLDIKPVSNMVLMKKDMGGAASVLVLAKMIMAFNIPVRLRVLIPAVENNISGNAFRNGDILKSRKGLTIEIESTDAEGRLILADALDEAASENPDLIIDMATLTGAARVAVGAEIVPFYTDNKDIAEKLLEYGEKNYDPVWQLPLWKNYEELIKGKFSDLKNSGGGMAGSITAALFLKNFITDSTKWIHLDIYGWTPVEKPAHPQGAEVMPVRALLNLVMDLYGKTKF